MNKAARIAKWIAACAAAAALICVLCSAIWWTLQPRHAGKTIHWWFAQASTRIGGGSRGTNDVESAFRSMGPQAVPFLVKRLQTPDAWPEPGLRQKWSSLKRKVFASKWVPSRIRELVFPPTGASAQFVAFELLKSMGSEAISAQPLLEEMLSQPDLQLHHEPFYLLRSFGTQASNSGPVVARFFSHTGKRIRSDALATFAAITPPGSPHTTLLFDAVQQRRIRAAEALPILVQLQVDITELLPNLGDELCMTGHFHVDALATCRQLSLQAKVLVPRFAEAMHDPDPGYRSELLGELRQDLILDATPALDGVIAALNDPEGAVRSAAARTLVAIKPGAEKLRAALDLVHAKKHDGYKRVAETIHAGLKTLEAAE